MRYTSYETKAPHIEMGRCLIYASIHLEQRNYAVFHVVCTVLSDV